MASIHRRADSPFWFCSYTLPTGKRAFRSTKQTDKKKALEVCLTLDKASRAARDGEAAEVQLRSMFDGILESVGARKLPNTSLRAFVESWLANKRVSLTPPVMRHYETTLTSFMASLGDARADKSIAAVGSNDVARYRDSRLGKIAVGTLGLEIKVLKALFRSALRQGLIQVSPVDGLELPRAKSLERETFSSGEISQLLAVADDQWRLLILLGFFTGGRLRDLTQLKWDNIDLERGTLTFVQAKTGRKVMVPLHPELCEALWRAASVGKAHGPLMPRLFEMRVSGSGGSSVRFARLMNKAGIDRRSVMNTKNSFAKLSFHSLRHSFTSALTNAGVSEELRMQLTGHRSSSVHQLYSHHEISLLRGAVETLPRLTEDY